MCYCYQKLRNWSFSVNLWEAVGGHGRPWNPDWLGPSDRSIWANQGSTASHGLPLSASHSLPWPRPPTFCHVICLSQSEEHGLSRTWPPMKWEAVGVWGANRPLTHTGWTSQILGAVWLISRLNALLRSVCVRGRSDSGQDSVILGPIWLISWLNVLLRLVWVRGRLASHRQITWLCGERPCSASHGLPPWPPMAFHLGLSDRSYDFVVRGHARPPMASHLGLPWPSTSDSLTDHMTLWWEAEVRVWSIGLPRPPTAGCESLILGPVGPLTASLADFTARGATGPRIGLSRLAVGGWSIRLSLWPLTSDSHGLPHGLTDQTLWQIWLSDRSDRSDRSDWS